LLAIGCAAGPAPPAPSLDPGVTPAISEACDELDSFASLPDLVGTFGAPVTHSSDAFANPHVAGQLDEVHSVHFEDAEAQFLVVGPEPKAFLLQLLRVHSKGPALRSQEWLGMPQEAFLKVAGPPYRSEGIRHFYACNETDEFAVEVAGGVITAVAWYPYVD
jgi:hypothetical protein